MWKVRRKEFLLLMRKVMREITGVLRVSSPNEESNEKSYERVSSVSSPPANYG